MNLVKLGNKEITEPALDNLIKLANSLEDVKTRGNGDVYVKFKNDVIIETGNNFAVLTEGFNVQYANQIHFNPEFEKETFKKMITESFSDTRYKIVEKAAGLLDRELTHDEISAVVAGAKLADYANFDRTKVKHPKKAHEDNCDHAH